MAQRVVVSNVDELNQALLGDAPTIVLNPGRYDVRHSSISIQRPVTLTAAPGVLDAAHGPVSDNQVLLDGQHCDLPCSGVVGKPTMVVAAGNVKIELIGLTFINGAGYDGTPFNNGGGGAGLSIGAYYENSASVTITRCTFYNNYARYGGGGLYVNGGLVTINNSTFRENNGDSGGAGGILIHKGDAGRAGEDRTSMEERGRSSARAGRGPRRDRLSGNKAWLRRTAAGCGDRAARGGGGECERPKISSGPSRMHGCSPATARPTR